MSVVGQVALARASLGLGTGLRSCEPVPPRAHRAENTVVPVGECLEGGGRDFARSVPGGLSGRLLPAESQVGDRGFGRTRNGRETAPPGSAARSRPPAGEQQYKTACDQAAYHDQRPDWDVRAVQQARGEGSRALRQRGAERRGELRGMPTVGRDPTDPAAPGRAGTLRCEGLQPGQVAADHPHHRTASAELDDGGLEGAGAAQDEDMLAAGLARRRRASRHRYDLLVLGELNVDIVVDCGQVRPRYGQVDQFIKHIGLVLGSSGAITAVAAARLGLRTAIIGVVADDEFGRFIFRELGAAGVDTSACRIQTSGCTGATVALLRNGDRAMLTSPALMGDLVPGDVDRDVLASASHVHVSSFYLQRRLQDGLKELLATARRQGTTTSLDPGWDPAGRWVPSLVPVLPEIDFFLPNDAEARKIMGVDRTAAAAAGLARHGPTVVVKRGRDGVLVHSGDTSWSLTAQPVAAVDSTGAGDNFNAGFLTGIAAGLDLATACALGSACGAMATQGYGGTTSSAAGSRAAWQLAMTTRAPAAAGLPPKTSRGQ